MEKVSVQVSGSVGIISVNGHKLLLGISKCSFLQVDSVLEGGEPAESVSNIFTITFE